MGLPDVDMNGISLQCVSSLWNVRLDFQPHRAGVQRATSSLAMAVSAPGFLPSSPAHAVGSPSKPGIEAQQAGDYATEVLLISHNLTVWFLNQRGVIVTFSEHFCLEEPGSSVLAVIMITANVSLACDDLEECYLPSCGEMGGE